MSTNNKKIHKISTSILSNDLRRHYEKHGVTGIERFISNKTDSNVLNDENEDYCDTKCASNLLSRATSHSSPSSRFIRFNPRYNEKDTLQILSVSIKFHENSPRKQSGNLEIKTLFRSKHTAIILYKAGTP